MKTMGKRISEYRKQVGMTQEDLAFRMNVSPQAVSKWENDLSIPDLPILIELANLFQITLDELVRQKEDIPVRIVPVESRKPFNQLLLRIVVFSASGDQVKVNLPMALVKAGLEMGMSMPELNGRAALQEVDLEQLIRLVECGAMGKLVEVDSANGDHVEIFVE